LLVFRLARLIPLRWGIRLGVILAAPPGSSWARTPLLAGHLKVAFPDWTDAERAATVRRRFAPGPLPVRVVSFR
jgi:lauroyl/myristoyl acyltransferase